MVRVVAALYAALIYGFIFLPVSVLVLYSFQATLFPIPPFTGPSLRWYGAVLADQRLTAGLVNSVVLALVTSAVATLLGFLAAWGLARFRLPASGLICGLIAAPLMVSYLIIGMGEFIFGGRPKAMITSELLLPRGAIDVHMLGGRVTFQKLDIAAAVTLRVQRRVKRARESEPLRIIHAGRAASPNMGRDAMASPSSGESSECASPSSATVVLPVAWNVAAARIRVLMFMRAA